MKRTINDMSRKELVKVLDAEFSKYVRMTAANDSGIVICPTCGRAYPWQQTDLSHYAGRKHLSVRWDERNVIAQCKAENRFQSGNIFKLRQVLVNRFGEEAIREVDRLAVQRWAEDEFSLRMKIIEYRGKVKRLKI